MPSMWAVVSIVAVLLLAAYRARKMRLRLPPGPPGLPLLGNLFDMPMKNLGQGFAKLALKYGRLRMVSLSAYTMLMVTRH